MFKSTTLMTEYLLASNPEALPEILHEIAESPDPTLRARVAENRSTPLSTLVLLLADKNGDVRLSLSHNPALPAMFLSQLVLDPDPDVRLGLAEDYRLPLSLLKVLAADENPYVAHKALRTLSGLSPVSYSQTQKAIA